MFNALKVTLFYVFLTIGWQTAPHHTTKTSDYNRAIIMVWSTRTLLMIAVPVF